MTRLRLAVALMIPEPFATEIDGIRRAAGGDLARIAPHITVVPPVDVREEELSEVLAVLRRAAQRQPTPLRLQLGPAATFAPVNRVLYLAVEGEAEELAALSRLREALRRGPLQHKERRRFVPHVTLTHRLVEGDDEHALAVLGSYRAEVQLDRVHLLLHRRPPPGARVWVPVADAHLGARRVVGRGGVELELTLCELVDPEVAAFLEGAGAPVAAVDDPASRRRVVVTARREGRVVGSAVARCDGPGPVAWLEAVAVEASQRRQGIAGQLLVALEHEAACRGASGVLAAGEVEGGVRDLLLGRGWRPAQEWTGEEVLARHVGGAGPD